MAVTQGADLKYDADGPGTFPSSIVADWQQVVAAGVSDVAIATPVTTINLATLNAAYIIFSKPARVGTHVLLRIAYPNDLVVTTQLKGKLFGRRKTEDDSDPWMPLADPAGDIEIELTSDNTNDYDDGALKWGTVKVATDAIDSAGCDEFIFLIETALDGTTGDDSLASVWAKVI